MDLKVILLVIIIFSFGELEHSFAGANDDFILDPPDSPKKKKVVAQAIDEFDRQSWYRYNKEESYRRKIRILNSKLKKYNMHVDAPNARKLQMKVDEATKKYNAGKK